MDDDEKRILSHYKDPKFTLLEMYRGEEAWSAILKIRYQPGAVRSAVKRRWKDFSKENAFLAIFLETRNSGQPHAVHSHYFLDKQLRYPSKEEGEGEQNKFDYIHFDALKKNDFHEDVLPMKFLRKLLINKGILKN